MHLGVFLFTWPFGHGVSPSGEVGTPSRRGAEGIIKKVGYLCVIAVAMVVDYLILRVAAEAGFEVATKAFFGLLVAVWYVLNELLSINKQRFELIFFTNIFRPPIRPILRKNVCFFHNYKSL